MPQPDLIALVKTDPDAWPGERTKLLYLKGTRVPLTVVCEKWTRRLKLCNDDELHIFVVRKPSSKKGKVSR